MAGIRIRGRTSGRCARATFSSSCPATRSSESWSDIAAVRWRQECRAPGPGDIAAFAAEHARNAGPTLYHLRFGTGSSLPSAGEADTVTRTVTEMRSTPDRWLTEGSVVRLVR